MPIDTTNQINVVINSDTKVSATIGQTNITGTIATGGRGYSAYEVWLMDGHTGTATDFLAWLRSDSYKYTQSAASTEWTIAHNLNKYPSVTIIDSIGRVVYGEIDYIDENTVKVSFSAAFSGKAYLN